MNKMIKNIFEDRVRTMGIRPGEEHYSVIFHRHAAFYKIDKSKTYDIQLLEESRKNSTPVQVECNAMTSEIIRVTPKE